MRCTNASFEPILKQNADLAPKSKMDMASFIMSRFSKKKNQTNRTNSFSDYKYVIPKWNFWTQQVQIFKKNREYSKSDYKYVIRFWICSILDPAPGPDFQKIENIQNRITNL